MKSKLKNIYLYVFILLFSFSIDIYSRPIYSSKDTVEISLHLDRFNTYLKQAPPRYDSAIYHINEALNIAETIQNDDFLFMIYVKYGELMTNNGNYSKSLGYRFKSLRLLDKKKAKDKKLSKELLLKYITTYSSIGYEYFHLEDMNKSLEYFNKALESVKQIDTNDAEADVYMYYTTIYNNIASVYLVNLDIDNAKTFFDKALIYNQKMDKGGKGALVEKNFAAIYNNLSIISKEQNRNDEAFEYLKKALEIRKRQNNKAGIAQSYNNLAKYYRQLGNEAEAISLLSQSIALSKESSSLQSLKIAVAALGQIYADKGDYKRAYQLSKEEMALNDSLLDNKKKEYVAQSELGYEYEKQRSESELKQQKEIALKERNTAIAVAIVVILGLLCLVLVLFMRNLKIKLNRDKLIKENIELENSNLNLEIEHKVRELTTTTLYLAQKNEFMSSIIHKLEEGNLTGQQITGIIREMKNNINNTVWDEFEFRFQEVHPEFYTRLNERFPNLTQNEIRLCAFLRLNMTTKEISSITFQSVKSIQVARTRLRKKMQIDQDDNLISTLMTI